MDGRFLVLRLADELLAQVLPVLGDARLHLDQQQPDCLARAAGEGCDGGHGKVYWGEAINSLEFINRKFVL